MSDSIFSYWRIRLGAVKSALEANNFEVFMAENVAHAKEVVTKEIIPDISIRSVSWGGSKTLLATGLCDYFRGNDAFEVVDTFDRNIPREEKLEVRRRALLMDLFITGTNAVTQAGQLVNLDMIGNRIGTITFGPKHVIILVGRNKIVADLDAAGERIKIVLINEDLGF